MSETELSVICKNCGSEVSPYVTECPYCGARLRKRAPKLERRGDGLEAKARRRPSGGFLGGRLRREGSAGAERPYATLTIILGSAVLLLLQKAIGDPIWSFGGIIVPFNDELWRVLTASFAYVDVGYLFVVAVALAIFGIGLERRLGTTATAILLVACGSLGMLAARGIVGGMDEIHVIAGGNGMALGAVGAWFMVRRSEAKGAIDQEYDRIGVAVAAAVLLALPIFVGTANVFAGLAGGLVGVVAGFATAARAAL